MEEPPWPFSRARVVSAKPDSLAPSSQQEGPVRPSVPVFPIVNVPTDSDQAGPHDGVAQQGADDVDDGLDGSAKNLQSKFAQGLQSPQLQKLINMK